MRIHLIQIVRTDLTLKITVGRHKNSSIYNKIQCSMNYVREKFYSTFFSVVVVVSLMFRQRSAIFDMSNID